jgi:hypothetical protein
MAIKATCPKDPKHKTFITSVHIVEDWVVDEDGRFIESKGYVETAHGPDRHNTWTCATCDADAKVEVA